MSDPGLAATGGGLLGVPAWTELLLALAVVALGVVAARVLRRHDDPCFLGLVMLSHGGSGGMTGIIGGDINSDVLDGLGHELFVIAGLGCCFGADPAWKTHLHKDEGFFVGIADTISMADRPFVPFVTDTGDLVNALQAGWRDWLWNKWNKFIGGE